jgi:hypothetical protein
MLFQSYNKEDAMTGHVALAEDKRTAHNILVGKVE